MRTQLICALESEELGSPAAAALGLTRSWRQLAPATRLHGVSSQEPVLYILTALRSSHLLALYRLCFSNAALVCVEQEYRDLLPLE
jgi:hypothetical protein